MKTKKHPLLELKITDLAFGARGVARENDFIWFVDGALPGQTVLAKPVKIKKTFGEAKVIEILEKSPYEVTPPCPYFRICGGCKLQHLEYDMQVHFKTQQIKDALTRIGGLPSSEVKRCIPAKTLYGYRNKMEFTFSDRPWTIDLQEKKEPFALGLHIPGYYDKVVNIEHCLLQSDLANQVLKTLHALFRETGLPAYNIRNHKGIWRFLILRYGFRTGELLVHWITTKEEKEKIQTASKKIAQKLHELHPEITSISHSYSDRLAQVAEGEEEEILYGNRHFKERIGHCVFEISPFSFFQTNTEQAEILFKTIGEIGDFLGNERVFDLYCGAGAIGIFIANQVREVIGIEIVPSAIQNAEQNKLLNHTENTKFISGDMDTILSNSDFLKKYGTPDAVIFDPPRGGPHPKTINGLIRLGSRKIIYVSCNPPILARDAKTLSESGYSFRIAQPIDLFPHTGHVETVALLIR